MGEKTVVIPVSEYRELVANNLVAEMLLGLIAERGNAYLPIETKEVFMLARLLGVAKEEEA